ncbi:hypothetical protein D3C86_1968150 [compost metagenome]
MTPSPSGASLELTQFAVMDWQPAIHDIAADHPAAVLDPSDVKRKVKQPVGLINDAATVPGLVAPL